MHEAQKAPAHPSPEPMSADECAWILDAASRLTGRVIAPQALLAHLRTIADVLDHGESAAFDPSTLRDLLAVTVEPAQAILETEANAPGGAADVLAPAESPVFDAVPDDEVPVAADPVVATHGVEAGMAVASAFPDVSLGPVDEAAAASMEPIAGDAVDESAAAAVVTGAAPLFPRSAAARQRRARKRGDRRPDEASDEASPQLALAFDTGDRSRVAVSHFAERMLRARERLATEEPTTSMGASAEVLSFAERLKKVRESLADEEGETGIASA